MTNLWTEEIDRLKARIAELESALRLNLAVSPDDPILITPAERRIAELEHDLDTITVKDSELFQRLELK